MAEGGKAAARVAEGIIAKAAKKVMPDLAEDALKAAGKDAAEDLAKDAAKDTAKDVAKDAGKDAAKDAERTGARQTAEAGQDTAKNVADRTATKDPIDVASGEVILHQVDVELPGVLPLVLDRTHVSSYRAGRWFGASWASTLDQRLEVDDAGVCFVGTEGLVLVYPIPMFGETALPERGPRRLLAIGDDGYTITDPAQGHTLRFAPQPSARVRGSPAIVLPLKSIIDRNGDRIELEYDGDGTLTEVRHSGGYRIGVETERGRITALRLLNAQDEPVLKRFGYSDAGRLTEVINSSGRPTRFSYDHAGRLTRWEDTNGYWYTYTYDEQGRGVAGRGSGGHLNSTLVYHDGFTVLTDSLGHQTTYRLNERGQVVAEVDPLGNATRSEWDPSGHLISRTDPLDRTTRYTYDEFGDLTTVTRPDGARTTIEHNGLRLPVRITEPDGAVWQQAYDACGNLLATTDPMGATTTYAYGEHGHLTAVTDPLGITTRVATNPAGLPVAVTDPLGNTVHSARDAFGRITTIENPTGDVTRFGYNTEGHLVLRESPDGGTERWSHDGEGNVVEYVDQFGGRTRYDVTCFDRRSAQTAPDGARQEFHYDSELRLVAVTEPRGSVWRYEYDPVGNLIRETDFNARVISYEYDAAGQRVVRRNGSGQTIRYTRDVLGAVVEKNIDQTITRFHYDPAGRLIGAVNDDVDLRLQRNSLGRVIAEVCNGRILSTTYDVAGRRIGRRTPSGVESTWHYDPAGHPVVLRTAGQTVQFSYDAAGREFRRHIGSGAILDQHWSADHRLRSQTLWGAPVAATPPLPTRPGSAAASPQPRLLQHRAYSYRADGKIIGVQDQTFGARRFELDAVGRISAVQAHGWGERYVYDPSGDIVDADWPGALPTDAIGDREYSGPLVTRAGRVRYEYDPQGRVVLRQQKRISSKPVTWRYSWDAEDRLVAVSTPYGQEWRYIYDPLGRRVAKLLLGPDRRSVVEQIDFVWDEFLLAEQARTVWPVSGPDRRTTTWNHHHDHGAPLTQLERSWSRDTPQQWFDEQFFGIVTDLVGTPTEMVDAQGNLSWRPRATLWGRHEPSAPGSADCPLRFLGQYFDAESGLHYNCRRYYDPDLGRYRSGDVIGLAGGVNPYSYVSNPMHWVDPLGLTPYEGNKFYRGSKGAAPTFEPKPNEYRVDPKTGNVKGTHGVSVFDNPESVSSKGFTPNEIDPSSIPDELTIIQRGRDPRHYEIVPAPGASLTPEEFANLLGRIRTK